jgi:hypothetical protein
VRALKTLLLILGGLACGCSLEPAHDPSQGKCWGQPVYLGYYCCNDGYPGQCPLELYCYPPDECRGPVPPNDSFRYRREKRK